MIQTLRSKVLIASRALNKWILLRSFSFKSFWYLLVFTSFRTLWQRNSLIIRSWSLKLLKFSFTITDMDIYQFIRKSVWTNIALHRSTLLLMDKEIFLLNNLVAFITCSIQNNCCCLWSYLLCRFVFSTTSLMNLQWFWIEFSITKLALNSFLFISMSRLWSLLHNSSLRSFLVNWLILLQLQIIPTKRFTLRWQHSLILVGILSFINRLIDNFNTIFIDFNDRSFHFFLFARSKMIT